MGPTATGSTVDLEHARSVAVNAVQSAGALLRERATDALGTRAKGEAGDVVTDLDLAAERLIVGRLRATYPGHPIIAEESGLLDAADDSWTWLIDPLDGTNNVIIGLNTYVVGVALCRDRVPVLGVVHDPVAGQTWSAVRAHGALGPAGQVWHPPRRISGEPVLAWTQGHDVRRGDGTAHALRNTLESGARRVLQLWAPLLSWVMLARGDIDGFVGYLPEAVDLPAGRLIAQEAGLSVCDFGGHALDERFDVSAEQRSFIAGRPEVMPRLREMVRTALALSV
jgi:myo-inositol-1(or 4)-monophosphatase